MTVSTIPTLADLRAELASYCGHPAKRGNKAKAKRVNESVKDYLRVGFSEYDAVRRTLQDLGFTVETR